MWKRIILIYMVSLFFFVLESPIRGLSLSESLSGPMLSIFVGAILYAALTWCMLKKYHHHLSTFTILFWVLCGKLTLDVLVRMLNFQDSLASLPNSASQILGVFIGYLYYKWSTWKRITGLSIVFLTLLWGMSFQVQRLWRHWLYNRTSDEKMTGWVFETKNGKVCLDSLNTEFIVLDFWSTRCGVCRKKFPLVQEFYNEFRQFSSLTIASVLVKYFGEKRDTGDSILRPLAYDFPVWSVDKDDKLLEKGWVKKYPTVLILDKNKTVVFNGRIEEAQKKIRQLLDE